MAAPNLAIPLAYLFCGALPLSLVPYIRRHRANPGSTGLLITVCGLACWAVATGVIAVATTYPIRLGAAGGVVLGAQLAGIGYFLIAAEYGDWLEPSRGVLAALAVPVLAFQLVVVTEPVHQLVWGGYGPGTGADGRYGPLFAVHQLIGFGFAVTGLAMFSAEGLTTRGVRRRQSVALLLAGVPPVVLAAVGLFVLTDVSHAISPFGFAVSAFLYAWALFRADFLEIVPVGRRRIVEEMDDAAVTLDADGRVVDANAAARRLRGVGGESRANDGETAVPVAEFFPALREPLERLDEVDDVDTELTIPVDGTERHFHLNTSRIGPDDDRLGGRLIVLHDITELKRRERALEDRERQLDLLRQVHARALRHNIRNDLTVVRGYAREIEDRADESDRATRDDADLAEAIVEKCDDLVDLSNKAATIERLVTRTDAERRIDLAEAVAGIVDRYRQEYPTIDFRYDAPARSTVETGVPIEFALENLIENAAEHNDGRDATVTVSVEREGGRAVVTVADDGPGIPVHELEVLRQGEETPLEHGSGLGLWIVYWIVEHSACSVSFSTGEDGTTITFGVPLADAG